jgi:hypothetical protein
MAAPLSTPLRARPLRRPVLALILMAAFLVALLAPATALGAPPAAPVLEQPTRLGYLAHPVTGWSVFLNWNDVAGATSYQIYDADTDGLLGTSTASTYVLFALPAGVYNYYVKALNAGAEVSGPSNTITVTFVPVAPTNPAPTGFKLVPNSNFNVSATGASSIPASVTIPYDPAQVTGDPTKLRLFHWNGSAWEDITYSVNTAGHTITGSTTSFSDFSAGEVDASGNPIGVPASSMWTVGLLALLGASALGVLRLAGASRR